MIVCHCTSTTDRAIADAIRAGAETKEQVGALCGAGTHCGGCHMAIASMLRHDRTRRATMAQQPDVTGDQTDAA